MLAREDRITALEKTTREHRSVLHILPYELTAVKGLAIAQGDTMQEMKDDMEASFKQLANYQIKTEQQIDTRFNLVDARLDKVGARLDYIDARLDQVDIRLDRVETHLDKVDLRLGKVDMRLDNIEATMATKDDLATLKEDFKNDMATLKEDLKNDMAAMENRILNAFQNTFQQVITMINTR